jgi:hypothetical protein
MIRHLRAPPGQRYPSYHTPPHLVKDQSDARHRAEIRSTNLEIRNKSEIRRLQLPKRCRRANWLRLARFTSRPSHGRHDNRLFPHTPVPPSLGLFCTISVPIRPRPAQIGFVLRISPAGGGELGSFCALASGTQPQPASFNPQSQAPGRSNHKSKIINHRSRGPLGGPRDPST